MKIVQINATCGYGSTGKIAIAISQLLTQNEIENYVCYTAKKSEYPLGIRYATTFEIKIQALLSRLFGRYGFYSFFITKRLIKHLRKIQPDIVHLHNLHGHNCNLKMLFNYLKKQKIKVFWTFHDCWAFTGYCPHFDMIGCQQWKTECKKCPQRKGFSWFFDCSKILHQEKKAVFEGTDLQIITPSYWLADLVKQSFLKSFPVRVIHNGIDLNVFQNQESDFREKYHLEDKFVLLGVSFGWDKKKGLDVFIELSKRLDERFQIVLVGTNESIDKKLPSNILSIHRTHDQKELAKIYSATDLFINPTREEVLGMVNLEALACGTPVITFQSGGSAEMLNASCGKIVQRDDVDGMLSAILESEKEYTFTKENCRLQALQYDQKSKFLEYVNLYKEQR